MKPSDYATIIGAILGPVVAGLVIYKLGQGQIIQNNKNEAIRDLMTYRGDNSSSDFRRSLNKVSITFHRDPDIRKKIRDLYELVNNASPKQEIINRKIVELIYDLCQKNGFKGITEYDIDQSFPETRQTPEANMLQPTQVVITANPNPTPMPGFPPQLPPQLPIISPPNNPPTPPA